MGTLADVPTNSVTWSLKLWKHEKANEDLPDTEEI